MKPDYLRQLLAASYPALARIDSEQASWASSGRSRLPRLSPIPQATTTTAYRYPGEQVRADEAGAMAEERFERFRGVCSVINSAYRQARAHHRLEQALEQLRMQGGA